jgi:hypothetical protein
VVGVTTKEVKQMKPKWYESQEGIYTTDEEFDKWVKKWLE